jgi:hypothetical protein
MSEIIEIKNDNDINQTVIHYFKSFGNQFKTWILKIFPNIDESQLHDYLESYCENDETLEQMQNIYIIKDINYLYEQHIKIIISYSNIEPEHINESILTNINEEESKKKLMTFLNNSFMSIKVLLQNINNKFNVDISEIEAGAMYFYKKNTCDYLSYYITFEKQ